MFLLSQNFNQAQIKLSCLKKNNNLNENTYFSMKILSLN